MTDLSELVVRIKADSSSLDRELKKATGSVSTATNQMGGTLSGLSRQFAGLATGLSVAALVGFVKQVSIAADRLNDLSARTGIAATTLSALELPLKQSGSSADEFASSITRMNNAIGEAASGQSEAAARAFTDLGLSISELMAMTPEQQFNAIAAALNGIQSQAEFTNKGMAIFGRQFASIAPVIREINGDMDAFIKRQQELGNSFTKEELQSINDFWDNVEAGVKKAEVAVIRLISKMAQLLTMHPENITIGKNPIDISNGGITISDSSSRVSTTRPDTVDSVSGIPKSTTVAKTRTQVSKELTQAEQDAKDALEAQKRAQDAANKSAEQFANTIKDRLSQGLTDAIFDAENAGDAFRRLGDQLARSIFEQAISEPFANAVGGAIKSSGIGSSIGDFFGGFLPSFDVGSPNVPRDMVAQIHKGERIIPANQNNPAGLAALAGGGSGVTVNQYFQSGVSRAELQAVLPQVASAAHDAVFASIQKGGSAAKIVGVR